MPSKYLIIINKTANHGKTKLIWPKIKTELNQHHIQYIATASKYRQNVNVITTEFIKKATRNDILMVIGGDGTLNQVLNCSEKLIHQHRHLFPLPIAYLPTGTKKYFAKRYHIPLNYRDALHQILFRSSLRQLPIGTFKETFKRDQKYFLNNMEIGPNNDLLNLLHKFSTHWHSIRYWIRIFQILYNMQSFQLSLYYPHKTKIMKDIISIDISIQHANLESQIVEKHNFFVMIYIAIMSLIRKNPRHKFLHQSKQKSIHLGIPSLEYSQIDNENLGSRYYDIHYYITRYPFLL